MKALFNEIKFTVYHCKPINYTKWLPIQVNQATSRPPGKGLRHLLYHYTFTFNYRLI